jgi:colicin import membrane protein
MNTELTINPKEFGIEETKAGELIGNLPQITSERSVLEDQYNEVVRLDIEDPKTTIVARELRLKIRDNRTKGLNVWHKTTKDVFLRAGQFIDALKNREIAVNERMEEGLQEIENYFERKEQARKESLKQQRFEIIKPYFDFFPNIDLANATEEDFTKAFNGAKLQLDAKIESDKKAEQERIEQEKKQAAEREAMRLENERLIKEAKLRDAQIEAERRAAYEVQRVIEEKARKEREDAAKIQAELEAKAQKERAEQQRFIEESQKREKALQDEIKAKEKARLEEIENAKIEAERIEKQRIETLRQAALAPRKEKLKSWVDSFEIPIIPVDQNDEVALEIVAKYNSFKAWAIGKITEIK